MKTIVVNLFGGPCSGKSTGAAYIFSRLKMEGILCEYVPEFAKDMVWEDRKSAFSCQMYISGNQAYRIHLLNDVVDVVITDSPICQGVMYNIDNPELNAALFAEFNKYNNVNYMLYRSRPYSTIGRNQTEDEAQQIQTDTEKMLQDHGIVYSSVSAGIAGYESIVQELLVRLGYQTTPTNWQSDIIRRVTEKDA